MWDRIKAFLSDEGGRAPGRRPEREEIAIACAALMVEAARMDGDYDEAEREALLAALSGPLGIPAADAARLLAEAETSQAEAVDLHRFLKVIGPRYDEADRVALIEMLWEVAYADGILHPFEAQLLRRIAGLLGVPDAVSGDARKRVLDRLGLAGR